MKTRCAQRHETALTRIDALVVLVIIAVLVSMILPNLARVHDGGIRPSCLYNLKMIGIAFNTFANDNAGDWPPQVVVTNGGIKELVPNVTVSRYFQSMADPLGQSPRCVVCPQDTRKAAADYVTCKDKNVSYFVSLDATKSMPDAILAGDRNLEAGGQPVRSGLFTLRTNAVVSWTMQMHSKEVKQSYGNLLFADGHSDRFTREELDNAVRSQGLSTNRIVVP